jgi:hypothetical protein
MVYDRKVLANTLKNAYTQLLLASFSRHAAVAASCMLHRCPSDGLGVSVCGFSFQHACAVLVEVLLVVLTSENQKVLPPVP